MRRGRLQLDVRERDDATLWVTLAPTQYVRMSYVRAHLFAFF